MGDATAKDPGDELGAGEGEVVAIRIASAGRGSVLDVVNQTGGTELTENTLGTSIRTEEQQLDLIGGKDFVLGEGEQDRQLALAESCCSGYH